MTSTVSASNVDDGISSELEKFRLSWKREIDAKRGGEVPGPSESGLARSSAPTNDARHPSSRAVKLYTQAVAAESLQRLDDALRLYRQAFRLDPDVDQLYAIQEQGNDAKVPKSEAPWVEGVGSSSKHAPETNAVSVPQITKSAGVSTLPAIIAGFPPALAFKCAEDEVQGDEEPPTDTVVPLAMLPDELLLVILKCLDHTSLERFASTCRKARVITCESSIWQDLLHATYCDSLLPPEVSLQELIRQYDGEHREVYIRHPRVRIDGLYISTCKYVRAGLSEDAWVNVSHLITYYRFLRFLPSGIVLSLLRNEDSDRPPRELIHSIKLDLRMKGLFIGKWSMQGSNVHITSLVDASTKAILPTVDMDVLSRPPSDSGRPYTFIMDLALKSTPVGKWNKLSLQSYSSVDTRNGEIVPLSLTKEAETAKSSAAGFWFSRVLSWNV